MDDSLRKFFYILGIIAAVYLLFRYLLPFFFKLLGIAVSVLFTVVMWVVIILLIVIALGFIVQLFKK